MKFRKKPVVIDAIQWNGDNYPELFEFVNVYGQMNKENDSLFIRTLEGTMEASLYDWIIKGIKGEYYPCKPDIFASTYDKVEQ